MTNDTYQYPDVVGVTVTYGDRAELCARTITAAAMAGCQHIVVVYNGCSAAVISRLESLVTDSPAKIVAVTHSENLGSAGGFNSGIANAVELSPKYVWLLDDDNETDPDALRIALAAHQYHSINASIGAEVAVFCNRTGSPEHLKLSCAGRPQSVFAPEGSFMHFDIWHRIQRLSASRVSSRAPKEILSTAAVPYGPYGGLLVSTSAIQKAGLPDSALFLYEDDTEYTDRLAHADTQLVWCRDAHVTDLDGKWSEQAGRRGIKGIVGSNDSQRLYMAIRNRTSFDIRRARSSKPKLARLMINGAAFSAVYTVLAVVYGRGDNVPIFIRAVFDGIRQDYRPYPPVDGRNLG